jgi:rubrerythrin
MELGTFGAILSFAMQLEKQAITFYEDIAQASHQEIFRELAHASHKRLRRLEQARREGVSEMILESITGLHGENYAIDFQVGKKLSDWLGTALTLESVSNGFYRDAADKIPIGEIARLFQRFAIENDRRRTMLEGYQ